MATDFVMRIISGAFAGALSLAAWGAACAQDPVEATLTISFQDIKATKGAILFVLVDSQAAYEDKARPFAQDQLAVSGGAVSRTVRGLAPGRYAIKAFHDLDGDGKMAINPFGMPTEPFAFSNGAEAMMGPPAWAAAAFEVKPGANAHAITFD